MHLFDIVSVMCSWIIDYLATFSPSKNWRHINTFIEQANKCVHMIQRAPRAPSISIIPIVRHLLWERLCFYATARSISFSFILKSTHLILNSLISSFIIIIIIYKYIFHLMLFVVIILMCSLAARSRNNQTRQQSPNNILVHLSFSQRSRVYVIFCRLTINVLLFTSSIWHIPFNRWNTLYIWHTDINLCFFSFFLSFFIHEPNATFLWKIPRECERSSNTEFNGMHLKYIQILFVVVVLHTTENCHLKIESDQNNDSY